MRRPNLHAACALVCAMAGLASAQEAPPRGMVHLSQMAPGIVQDIRYAREFNFTARPVPGYEAGECILSDAAARALIRVEARLRRDGYGLIVFDCYRPTRAVAAFVDWTGAQADDPAAGMFHPGLARRDLIPGGYIARRSGHSRGNTVDLGLIRADERPARPGFKAAGRCDGPFKGRAHESSLDMGTTFDCFSPRSALAAPGLSPAARSNRQRLHRAMAAEGFRGYAREWWHFRLDPAEGADFPAMDFPVRAPADQPSASPSGASR